MNCKEREDDILLYAIGALEDPDRSVLRKHLATGCPPCTGLLAEAEASWSLVGLSATQSKYAVPASAKAALDARIEGAADGVGSPEKLELRLSGEPAPVVLGADRLRIGQTPAAPSTGNSGWGRVLLAACLAMGITAGASWLIFGTEVNRVQREADGLRAEVSAVRGAQQMVEDELKLATTAQEESNQKLAAATASIEEFKTKLTESETQLSLARSELTSVKSRNQALDEMVVSLQTDLGATRKFAEMLYSKQLLTLDLKGQPGQPDAQARLFVDLQNKIWKLYTTDLKPLDGRVYEFWLITADGAKVPMGSFTVGPNGQGTLDGIVPDPLPKLAAAAVSDEPGPGAKQPTGTLHVIGSFQ